MPTVDELEKKYPNHVFRYPSSKATTKHAIRVNLGDGTERLTGNRSAECGRSPVWYAPSPAWLGTGSQEEYEKNDSLPLCKRCLVKLSGGSFAEAKPSILKKNQ